MNPGMADINNSAEQDACLLLWLAKGWKRSLLIGAAALLCLHLATAAIGPGQLLALPGAIGLMLLSLQTTGCRAFYAGLLIGLGLFVPHTLFFWTLFPWAALALWLLLALWHGLFLLLLQQARTRLGGDWWLLAAPFLWTGLEYTRCEIWPLRFAWLPLGGLGPAGGLGYYYIGVYGLGFLIVAAAAVILDALPRPRRGIRKIFGRAVLVAMAAACFAPPLHKANHGGQTRRVRVAGLQMEFPSVRGVLQELDAVLKARPDTELFILSEYAFTGPVPDSVLQWCKTRRRWLVAGGREFQGERPHDAFLADQTPASLAWCGHFHSGQDFRNTVYVVNTNGSVVHSQAKSQPIQFMQDGLPALSQRLWESPWGRIGIAICYDASYRNVMDRLSLQGAEALIIPAMDVMVWGEREHRWNAFQARLRAAEYALPVVRVASSGISQYFSPGYGLRESTGIGEGHHLFCELEIPQSAGRHAPLDHWGAPACAMIAGGIIALLCFRQRSPTAL